MEDPRISQLYVYPIKSLRGTSLSSAIATVHGFKHDRKFMLLKDHGSDRIWINGKREGRYENMHVTTFHAMALFTTEIHYSGSENSGEEGGDENKSGDFIMVTYNPPSHSDLRSTTQSLKIPLNPDHGNLINIPITMHGSSCMGYNMGHEYNDWFTSCFGFQTILVYLGNEPTNHRPVLFKGMAEEHATKQRPPPAPTSWLETLTSSIPFLPSQAPEQPTPRDNLSLLTFADCAPYLIVTQPSCDQVSTRFPRNANTEDRDPRLEMDIRKFRPNIIVAGPTLPAFAEDSCSEIAIYPASSAPAIYMSLPHNRIRCVSINVSFHAGETAEGAEGQALKLLQRDRRVDMGARWSPVFGRYGFLFTGGGRGGEGGEMKVGDVVRVTAREGKGTRFDWPGVG